MGVSQKRGTLRTLWICGGYVECAEVPLKDYMGIVSRKVHKRLMTVSNLVTISWSIAIPVLREQLKQKSSVLDACTDNPGPTSSFWDAGYKKEMGVSQN